MTAIPRGIRNHNPGNIEKGSPWQGLAEDQSADRRFCVFKAPEWGIRAIARILVAYQDKHKLKTVRGIINRWAPPNENDTAAYVEHVAGKLGVDARLGHVDVTDYETCRVLVEAIIRHENGPNRATADGRWYDAATVNRGLELAGIEAPLADKVEVLEEAHPLSQSRTVRGGQVAAAGGTVALASAGVAELAPAVPVLGQFARVVENNATGALALLGLLTICAVGYMIYARIDDRQKGLR